jgi:hypothetical protein
VSGKILMESRTSPIHSDDTHTNVAFSHRTHPITATAHKFTALRILRLGCVPHGQYGGLLRQGAHGPFGQSSVVTIARVARPPQTDLRHT